MTHLVSLFAGEELGGVSVSDKIAGLAKKNKQLCVEVEKEKTKCRQSNTRIQALEKQVQVFFLVLWFIQFFADKYYQ